MGTELMFMWGSSWFIVGTIWWCQYNEMFSGSGSCSYGRRIKQDIQNGLRLFVSTIALMVRSCPFETIPIYTSGPLISLFCCVRAM